MKFCVLSTCHSRNQVTDKNLYRNNNYNIPLLNKKFRFNINIKFGISGKQARYALIST